MADLPVQERNSLIQRYADGPARLAAALATVPEAARNWRPAADAWSVHEIIIHCADSEAMAAGRIRLLAIEPSPVITGYDQDAWAIGLDYHSHPLEPALSVITAVRANTAVLLHRLPASTWERVGHHSQSGTYTAQDWLRTYAAHLHDHADQIEANLAAWTSRGGAD